MIKNLTARIVVVVVLLLAAAFTVWPPKKTLKPGIDLAGGTSLIYEIDAEGLNASEKKDLSGRMITVLRRRIDPANIQNLIWRPQGNTRFEIQMPLASAEASEKREDYEKLKRSLLEENISAAVILRSLAKGGEERAADFNDFARGSSERQAILDNLAKSYDEWKEFGEKRDRLVSELETSARAISSAGLNMEEVKAKRAGWAKLDEERLTEALKQFAGSEEHVELLRGYVKSYAEWDEVTRALTEPETGKRVAYEQARQELDKMGLTEEQLVAVLEKPVKSAQRREDIDRLKREFSDRAEQIEAVVSAFDEYRPYRGRLDDPRDLQRMLKGAGILEFRILPTMGHPAVDAEAMSRYVETLKEKGPKYASDSKYIWCEVEKAEEWAVPGSVTGQFGDKSYVLASNKPEEVLLHSMDIEKSWKLEGARATQDREGRRAIGFALNERGGKFFWALTSKNIDRPLCIMLDGIAISAPNIRSAIRTDGIIEGSFSETEVGDMVNKLNAGSLPARLIEQPISVKTIGPSIGADNRDKGIRAGIIGLVAVVACMGIYYMLAGSIADTALLMNLLFVLAIMALVRATFTLPGIAGIILTIGMSVDANVLIFERIREEQQRGASLRIAIRNGYQRAFRTILDSNLTTFITAAILFWVASEEIKGFAIVLMLGIISSMFTALFVTRTIFDILLSRRIIKDHLFMLRLIQEPKVNWMGLRPVFLSFSAVLICGGLTVFFTRDDTKNNKYDIEFTGGTSAQINLLEPMTREEVESTIRQMGASLGAPTLASATVYSVGESGKQFEINTTATNRTTSTVSFSEPGQHTVESIRSAIRNAESEYGTLSHLEVRALGGGAFEIATSRVNRALVKNVLTAAFPTASASEPSVDEIVNNAILEAFQGKLAIQQNLEPKITLEKEITEAMIETNPMLADYLGGMVFTVEISRPVTADEIESRFTSLHFKPDTRNLNWSYQSRILGADMREVDPNKPVKSFAYVSVDPKVGVGEEGAEGRAVFVENEKSKILAATELETSLPRVTQIDPSVGAEAKTRALIAIVLSLFAIVAYIWVRFGDVRYGLAAIVALVHDVSITLGAVTACTYIAGTSIGEWLLVGDFKIDLAMIAAFLTLIGYSLNDTIVVFDRIRENRRKGRVNAEIITGSINQTMARTLMTSFTTFIVVLIMYIFGGSGLRGFNLAIGFGIIIGTYSSVAIAAPLLLLGHPASEEKGK
ncbi:MAG TPA: protein translocase subunit SecD [Sedimentisphaerales bacterium]|nr:protein translocase subunit SecD [Sedimentisphaerales bacterium]